MTTPPWRHRRRWTRCGCPIDDHAQGCRRAELHDLLLADPFPAPRLSVDDEIALIRRVHQDPEYAAKVLAQLSERFGIAA